MEVQVLRPWHQDTLRHPSMQQPRAGRGLIAQVEHLRPSLGQLRPTLAVDIPAKRPRHLSRTTVVDRPVVVTVVRREELEGAMHIRLQPTRMVLEPAQRQELSLDLPRAYQQRVELLRPRAWLLTRIQHTSVNKLAMLA